MSSAERERLHASLRTRGGEVVAAVDRDISRTFAAFQVEPQAFDHDPAGTLVDAAAEAASQTASGAAVKAIFVAEPGGAGRLQRLDTQTRTLADATWPPALS